MNSFYLISFTQYLIDVFRKKSDMSEVEEENNKRQNKNKSLFYNYRAQKLSMA